MYEWLIIIFSGAIAWYWWDSMACKEIALKKGTQACRENDVQFLDQTVALKKTQFRRSQQGKLVIMREYEFEFTSDDEYRYKGYIQMDGRSVEKIELDAYRVYY